MADTDVGLLAERRPDSSDAIEQFLERHRAVLPKFKEHRRMEM